MARKSSQLTAQNTCVNRKDIEIREQSDFMYRAAALKNVIKRVCFKGEEIPDIKGEIRSILASNGYMWENYEQMRSNLDEYALNISKLAQYFHGEYITEGDYEIEIIPGDNYTEEERTIDYFGEPVVAVPDFIRIKRDSADHISEVYIGKIKTSNFSASSKSRDKSLEVYALGELGRKLFPHTEVCVDVLHLGTKSDSKHTEESHYNDFEHSQKNTYKIDVHTDAAFTALYEKEQSERKPCSGSDCAGCFLNNICHYEDPPIASDIEREDRVVGEIRLSDEQEQIVNFKEGIARVNAGAGSGKTFVVAHRIKKLVEDGVDPRSIALLTFTRAGAEEMERRTEKFARAAGLSVQGMTSATFNSFCMDIITRYYEELGYSAAPLLLSTEDKYSILNDLLARFPKIENTSVKYGLFTEDVNRNKSNFGGAGNTALDWIKKLFEDIKKNNYTLSNCPYSTEDFYLNKRTHTLFSSEDLTTIFSIYDAFNKTLFERNMIEYDDQIRFVFKLGEEHPEVFSELVTASPEDRGFVENVEDLPATDESLGGYQYIIVDEFQDTDLPQINLMKKLIDTPDFKGLMVVGDDSQSIYGFRYTSPEYMINFKNYFGDEQHPVHDFALTICRRCTPEIIKVANYVNRQAISRVDKDMKAIKPSGAPVEVKGFYSQEQEYEYIANCIKDDWEKTKLAIEALDRGETPEEPPKTIAFLGREKTDIQLMASYLTKLGVPSVICNPIPYISNSRVAALCSFYSSWKSGTTQGFLDYQNVLLGGALKDATAEELVAVKDRMQEYFSGVERSYNNFMNAAEALDPQRKDDCFQAFLEKIENSVNSDPDRNARKALDRFFKVFKMYGLDECYRREGNYEGVCLTTAHSSKGLEWDYVYGSVTKYDSVDNHIGENYTSKYLSKDHDEDLRLAFVLTTRAREKLCITAEYLCIGGKKKTAVDRLNRPKNNMLKLFFKAANLPYTFSMHDLLDFQQEQERLISEEARSDELTALLDNISTVQDISAAMRDNDPTVTRSSTRGRRRTAREANEQNRTRS